MTVGTANSDRASRRALETADLTNAVFGTRLSLAAAMEALEALPTSLLSKKGGRSPWVGSIGYEKFKSNAEFADALARADVEILVDVRDLPISRKRGFAKTALAEAVTSRGMKYKHVKGLGNPKEIRDLYKAGHVDRGRVLFESLLANEREEHIVALDAMIASSRVALMCVEHDEDTCHRQSILLALRERNGELEVGQLA